MVVVVVDHLGRLVFGVLVAMVKEETNGNKWKEIRFRDLSLFLFYLVTGVRQGIKSGKKKNLQSSKDQIHCIIHNE